MLTKVSSNLAVLKSKPRTKLLRGGISMLDSKISNHSLGNGESSARVDLRTNLSSAGDMFIEFNAIQVYRINSEYYNNVSCAEAENFEIQQSGEELAVSREEFINGVRQIFRQRSGWAEIPLEKMRKLLLTAYLSVGVVELEAERNSEFMAKVLHKSRIYFVSERSAFELVAYHESKKFATNAIYSIDKKILNIEFYKFIEQVLSPGSDGIELALFDIINDCSLESYQGAVTLQPLVALPRGSISYLGRNTEHFLDIDCGTSIPFHVNLVLDLKKLYENLGCLDFHEAIFSWVVAILINTPLLEKKCEIQNIYCAAHAYILPGLPCPFELKNVVRSKVLDLEDRSDFSAVEALIEEFYEGKGEPELNESEFEFGEFEFEQNFDFSEFSFATDIAVAAEYLFFKCK